MSPPDHAGGGRDAPEMVPPSVLRGLTTGEYVLEIEDKQRSRRFQIRFDIESSP